MKNVQVIDGATNCAYDVFAATDKDFALLFPNGRDVEFIGDFFDRVDEKTVNNVLKAMWNRRQDKKKIDGIHGTLFYELDCKKEYYPTGREADLDLNFRERDCLNRAALLQAAQDGIVDAQYHLGAMLAAGEGGEMDTERAAFWYRKAAAKKHSEALYNLGLMYLVGEINGGSGEKGQTLIEEAADRGSWDANWFLGQIYLTGGHGVGKDRVKGMYCLTHALGCRFANAALALGLALKESGRMQASALSDAFIHVAARDGDEKALGLVPVDLARKLRRRLKERNQ